MELDGMGVALAGNRADEALWVLSIREVLYPMAPLTFLTIVAIAVTPTGWLQTTVDLHGSARWARTRDVKRA
jgi:hypothetical protein